MNTGAERSLKILIAEDNYLVSEEIVRGLNQLGYTDIIEVSDGRQAVDKASEVLPDLVLMDIQMPKLDGIEATKEIQSLCPCPIIILTAYESQELVEKAGKAGAAAYLTKPPEYQAIERAITIALARHQDLVALRTLNEELQQAAKEIKRLRGLLPICAACKKIRDDKGYWHQIEAYITEHSEAQFTHSICDLCMEKLYPDD